VILRCRALAVLAGAATLTLTGLSPATAARWAHDDALGDVQSVTDTFDPGTGEGHTGEPTSAPDNTDTDVDRVSLRHSSNRVVLHLDLRNITVNSGIAVYDIRTDVRNYSVMQRLGTDRSFPAFDISRANGNRVRCAGVERSVDRAANRATLSIPRRCLDRPRWVRVGTGAAKFKETETSFTVLLDDAVRDAGTTDDLALSPRVRRS
jgi:hypothetical protein